MTLIGITIQYAQLLQILTDFKKVGNWSAVGGNNRSYIKFFLKDVLCKQNKLT